MRQVNRKVEAPVYGAVDLFEPRQVSIVLYLYKQASRQKAGATVSFRSNDLLESLGHTRTKDGGFASKLRSQLNRLVALHRTELVFAQSLRKGNNVGAKGLFCLFFAQ